MVEIGLGLLVGLVLALTGAGGGILTVPLLIFVVGLELHQAAPIGLMAVGLAAWVGAVIGLRDGIVRYKAAALMACCGVLLAPVGVWLAARVEHDVLAVVFALVMFWVAFRAFRRPPSDDTTPRAVPCRLNPQTGRFHWTSRCAATVAASGTLAGFLSGLLGVGGGFVLVPALSRFSDLPMRSIAATSLAVIGLVFDCRHVVGGHRPGVGQRRVVRRADGWHSVGSGAAVFGRCGAGDVCRPHGFISPGRARAAARLRVGSGCCRVGFVASSRLLIARPQVASQTPAPRDRIRR